MNTLQIAKSDVVKRTRMLLENERSLFACRQWLRIHICPYEKLMSHIPKGARLLDVGCGGGLFLGLLALGDSTISGTGVDNSRAAIASAARMAQKFRMAGIKFACAQSSGSWPHEEFNIVSLIDVLHHVEPTHRRQFFHEAAQRVPVGGHLICKDMRPKPRWKAAANILHDLIVARQFIHHSNMQSVESWGLEAGLRLRRYEEWDRLWYAHALWVFQRDT